MTIALWYSAFVGTWLALRTDWGREVKKVMDRLRLEKKLQAERRVIDEERTSLVDE
jgi:hypothetical protein